jgi:SAM-dependent MidA family methyltransferase
VIVDVSPELIGRQQKLLAEFSGRVRWHDAVAQLDKVSGCFISNELADSLPHHQVVMTANGLREVFVDREGGGFVERLQAPSSPDISAYFERLGITLPEGYRTEVNLRALEWIRQVGAALEKGHVLTVDYGYPADVYYRPDRKTGTFLCYHEHKLSEDPYARLGRQDLTAHVDFTSLARAGRAAGLEVCGFTDQAHFLVGMGITRVMEKVLERDGGDPETSDEFKAMRRLMDPLGMGKVFKVLVQRKGVPDMPLSGFSYRSHSVADLVPENTA